MKYQVLISQRAEAEIELAFQWIKQFSFSSASKWLDQMTQAIASLEEHPDRHPLTPETDYFPSIYGKCLSARNGMLIESCSR